MRLGFPAMLLTALALSWATQDAQAGAIRYLGKQIRKGATPVAAVAAGGGEAVAQRATTVGQATGGAVKTGVVAAGKGIQATPGLVVRGTKAAAKGFARAIW